MTDSKLHMKSTRLVKVVYLLIPVVAVLAAAVYVATDTNKRFVPETLGDLTLGTMVSGDAAREMINHLHAKGVTPERNEIGSFRGPGGTATLYVSVYGSREDATRAEEKMSDRIRGGNPIFGRYEELRYGKQGVKRCYGMGQEHYFFSTGANLYWLAADTPVADRTLQSLLEELRE